MWINTTPQHVQQRKRTYSKRQIHLYFNICHIVYDIYETKVMSHLWVAREVSLGCFMLVLRVANISLALEYFSILKKIITIMKWLLVTLTCYLLPSIWYNTDKFLSAQVCVEKTKMRLKKDNWESSTSFFYSPRWTPMRCSAIFHKISDHKLSCFFLLHQSSQGVQPGCSHYISLSLRETSQRSLFRAYT